MIVDKMEEVILKHPGYGYRSLTGHFKNIDFRIDGEPINHKRIYRLMKNQGLLCQTKKHWINTTNSDHHLATFPNLIKELDFTPTGLNQLWVSDITYIRLPTEFVYLATVLDAYSRRIVGFSLSRELKQTLTIGAIEMALANRQIYSKKDHDNLIFHSDKGSQYCSKQQIKLLKSIGARISMSAKGAPWQNPQAESFFATLKKSEVYLNDYQDFKEAKENITEFIENTYNKERVHSSLGYCPPEKFELELIKERDNIKIKSNIKTRT